MNQWTRRGFLQSTMALGVAGAVQGCASLSGGTSGSRPNILVIITDDQGYGDLACHGNPHLRTPNLDRLHAQSARLANFYVSPVCSPTRASLMTGRYNYRTGVVDTFMGRSMMHPDEITLAEVLRDAGYHTGIFGKWHLGDNYPLRAMDQGFEESLVHKGGGLTQPSDPPGHTDFNPILQHNGEAKVFTGYCTDIFAQAAMDFMRMHQDAPFFAYLATNAPHTPLQIADSYVRPYLDMGLDETTAKVYGMIENIDENIGRVLDMLEETGHSENTLVCFLTDNGGQIPEQAPRFNGNLRGAKATVYEGGIHVPCFLRYPNGWAGAQDIPQPCAHIDLFPTLLDLCGLRLPEDRVIDGRSLLPLLNQTAEEWPDRYLYFQWHRGDVPEMHRDAAVRGPRYKLIRGMELYDLQEDPAETTDIAAQHPAEVAAMRTAYEAWFKEVAEERFFLPPPIGLGGPENPVLLTPQDWRGAESWRDSKHAWWVVEVLEAGQYDVVLDFLDAPAAGTGVLLLPDVGETPRRLERIFPEAQAQWHFTDVPLDPATGRLEFQLTLTNASPGIRYTTVTRTQ